MKQLEEILVSPLTSILKVIKTIDTSSLGIALVVDEERRLLGTVTDGDIRRGILKGTALTANVQEIMNTHPTIAQNRESREGLLALMRYKDLKQIPIVDEHRRVIRLEVIQDLMDIKPRENWVVLMAGGLGQRLGALTSRCPKPLLPVGNKPILETILQSFIEHGFRKFYITVNYKAHMIEKYFGDGTNWGAEICCIREDKRLGTAGALSLLPEKPSQPLIVMNGDLLTKVNFKYLLDFHLKQESEATMCVREYTLQVPYGVVQIDKHRLLRIEEKPSQQFFVSGGIYVLNPSVLEYIPTNMYFDMPALFEAVLQNKKHATVFPIREYWLDIGQVDDFNRANTDFSEVFKND